MTIKVNESVVNGFQPFPLDGIYSSVIPKFASPSSLSEAENAPWTNRVPEHEPWPRTLMANDQGINSKTDQCDYNTHHNPQFEDDGGAASESINRVEGQDTLDRGPFWRR